MDNPIEDIVKIKTVIKNDLVNSKYEINVRNNIKRNKIKDQQIVDVTLKYNEINKTDLIERTKQITNDKDANMCEINSTSHKNPQKYSKNVIKYKTRLNKFINMFDKTKKVIEKYRNDKNFDDDRIINYITNVKQTSIKKGSAQPILKMCFICILMLCHISFISGVEDFTSMVIAKLLGYPTQCTFGTQVRSCTLSITCWMSGGTRVKGCAGGWLFSCCVNNLSPSYSYHNGIDNSVPSEWWYQHMPPQLLTIHSHDAIQSNRVEDNTFRRRVDEDITQVECGIPASKILHKRIIGGREAKFAEFPWQAHVRISEFQCGGVLVSRRYVATAAHCVSRASPNDITVWLGAVDTATAISTNAVKLSVVQKILHPMFQFKLTQPDRYDIALLKLSKQINYMNHILPICLPDHYINLNGRSGIIAGWGKTDSSAGHTGTNTLRSASVPILNKEQCMSWHRSKEIYVEIHSEMLCAGHKDGHQDACLGDSGGPLILLDGGRYYLIGITSAGFGCGVDHQPGIYHNVKTTSVWIKKIISRTKQ